MEDEEIFLLLLRVSGMTSCRRVECESVTGLLSRARVLTFHIPASVQQLSSVIVSAGRGEVKQGAWIQDLK